MEQETGSKPPSIPLRARIKKFGLVAGLRTWIRRPILYVRWHYLAKFWGMDIHPVTLISLQAKLDRTNPKGVHIGEGTAVNFGAVIFSHDLARNMHLDTRIGRFCMIGVNSIILPGLTVGDHSIVGAGAVVTRDVPPCSIVAGNPARIIRQGIMTGFFGKMTDHGQKAD